MSPANYRGLRVIPPGTNPDEYQLANSSDSNPGPPYREIKPGVFDWRVAPAGDVPVRNLVLPEDDERHRRDASPSRRAGLCVDELCSCGLHTCPPPVKTLPFEGDSTYQTTYRRIHPEAKAPQPPPSEPKTLPFEGTSTYRAAYDPSIFQTALQERAADKAAADARAVEDAKRLGLVGPNGEPLSAAEVARRKGIPETRDFGTTYDKYFKKQTIESCPVTRLPPVPPLRHALHHSFWDARTHQWY